MRGKLGHAAGALGAVVAILSTSMPVSAQIAGSRETRDFIAEAGQTDTFEMMEAASALASTRNPRVATFAEKMLQDHAMTTSTLRAAASAANLDPPPAQMSTGQAAFLAALQSTRGTAFDRLYCRQQVLAHQAALVVTERYATTGDTASVRQAAAQAVPIIRAHLIHAEQLEQAVDAER